MKANKSTVIFLVGPTSSGKTEVAVRIAEEVGGEVISSDSMQVYRDMDLITQAPCEEYLSRIKHHLVKKLSPEEEFSAARFALEAEEAIKEILGSGKTPILAGGTGLYVKSLVDGLFSSPPKNEEIRKKLGQIAKRKGTEYLHAKLEKIDPEAAGKIHPNDLKRTVRALEVYEITGSTITDKKTESEGILKEYDCRFFALKLPRSLLYERVEENVDRMFERGIIDEVKSLRARDLSITAEKALGIKEVGAFLDGEITLEDAKRELKKNTRRYAKRQMTWFKADKRIVWIDADRSSEEITGDILERL